MCLSNIERVYKKGSPGYEDVQIGYKVVLKVDDFYCSYWRSDLCSQFLKKGVWLREGDYRCAGDAGKRYLTSVGVDSCGHYLYGFHVYTLLRDAQVKFKRSYPAEVNNRKFSVCIVKVLYRKCVASGVEEGCYFVDVAKEIKIIEEVCHE